MDEQRVKYAAALRARLSRASSAGLLVEDEIGPDEIVANYQDDAGRRVLAFCLDGLMIDPDGSSRFIPFQQIRRTDYHDIEALKSEKSGVMRQTISLTLEGGEIVDLDLASRADRFSERLEIGRLIEQRARFARAA